METKMKNKLALLILSSVICLLPIILALALYADLPEELVVHWDIDGNPNRFAPKALAAFGLPVFFALINIFIRILIDSPKRENIPKVMRACVEWLVPFLSLIIMPVILFSALGAQIPIPTLPLVFVGIVVIIIGNYLPKTRQNYIVGIRLPWTLKDAENWKKTNRMAGYLCILGGLIFIIAAFVSYKSSFPVAMIIAAAALMVIPPILYSYFLHRRKLTNARR